MVIKTLLIFFSLLLSDHVQFSKSVTDQIFLGGSMRGQNQPLSADFRNNLKIALDTLVSQSSQTGFYHSTVGESPDQVTAMYLCRGDLNGQDCSDCVTHVTDTILNVSNTEWRFGSQMNHYTMVKLSYEHCMFRFSNESFIGKMNLNSSWAAGVSGTNNNGTLGNKIRFFEVLSDTLNRLPGQAASDESGKRFATKVVNISKYESLSAMAQCTWDITPCDCNACLSKFTAKLLPMSVSPGSSGRADSNNCMVSYESLAINDFTPNVLNGPGTGDIQAM